MIIYNKEQLEIAKADIDLKFNEYGSLYLEYEKPYKDKTLNQLGFIFGALIKSIQDFFKDKGEKWEINDIKENLYCGCFVLDDTFKKRCRRFNGEIYETPLRLSEMDREQASLFIDRCLYLIDHSKVFSGLALHPSIRYTWVMHLNPEEIKALTDKDIPEKDNEYLAYVRKQSCIWCGRSNCIEAHHLRLAGLSGTGIKAKDCYALPLCSCHRVRLHQNGGADFYKAVEWITKYVSIDKFCLCCYNRWKNKL